MSDSTSSQPTPTTVVSPYARDERADDYGKDGFWQNEIIKQAFYRHKRLSDGSHADLRGRSFTVTVSDDGLSVTITDNPNPQGSDRV